MRLNEEVASVQERPEGGVIDAADVSFSSIADVGEGQPVCMLGLRVHILVAGATFNLHTRHGAAGDLAHAKEEPHAHSRSFRLCRPVPVRPFPGHSPRAGSGELEAWPTGRLGTAFVDALAAALPGLAEHGCSYREPGGFFRRMREDEGTWLGHVLEHVAIELQNIAGRGSHLRQDAQRPARAASIPWSTSMRSVTKASQPANSG